MLKEIMGKLNYKFTETIFCKQSSESEKQIEALKILIN